MSGRHPGWAAQQLAEFLAAVSACPDEAASAREGVERAAEAVDADVAALVRDGIVVASIGWPRFEVPERDLAIVAARGRGQVTVPGSGDCPSLAFRVEGDAESFLVVARSGGEPFDREDHTLLRGMARSLALTMRLLRTIAAERVLRSRSDLQARENARLLESLRKRQRVLEAMAGIQRSISRRDPLHDVLTAICAAAADLLGDAPALVLRDAEDPDRLVTAATNGYDAVAPDALRARRIGEGVAGRAVAEGRLVVVEDYAASDDAMPEFVVAGVEAAMAAPVHDDGRVTGSLIVSSFQGGRSFSRAEQDTLRSFAEHASLALTDARRAEEMLHQALHDALTGLPNRALFTDRLQHALSHGRRRGASCGVLFIDLDRFKTINDSLGHAAGDDLLVAVARRLAGCLRGADTAARLGGDEFAVLLEDLGSSGDAVLVADRLIEQLRTPVEVRGREVFVNASIGIAIGDGGATDLLRHADVAMYRAKALGRGRWAMFEDSMQAAVVERLELEGDLQHAISRGEIAVHYQPVIALVTGELAGFEALARWRHPTRGLVPPPHFIPVAEESGSIVPLGRHVLRMACAQAAAWLREMPTATPPLMSVNLSGRQLEDPAIVDDVADALATSGLPPEALVLEITETVLMQDTEATISRLHELRALGVRLAVDDFGTGYSSLRYLRRFPIDILKMAKPFVDGLQADDEGRALARAIVDLASSLHLACVAEGIEAAEQAAMLRELGCGLGQGFHFARPMSAADLGELLRDPDAVRTFALPPA